MQKLAIVTSTRAEYGLLRRVIKAMCRRTDIDVNVIVTGTHLSAQFGNTVDEIEKDDIDIAAKIPILEYGTSTAYDTTRTMAHTLMVFTQYFNENTPNAVMLLGDRYEILAVSLAASGLSIPVIHISGGDVTHGAQDDYYRHCITKTAALHFPSCRQYAQRVIRLGEQPDTVHNVGGLGDENIRKLKLLSMAELSEIINYDVKSRYFLVTYHPQTAGGHSMPPIEKFKQLINALQKFSVGCIFTKANADAGGAEINNYIDKICAKRDDYIAFTSMGVLKYLSAMKYCAAVVGNSSSGVVETPTMGVPAINIGTRQSGRIICNNVVCCDDDESSIEAAIIKVLENKFAQDAKKVKSPYNGGDTAQQIADITSTFMRNYDSTTAKIFYDGKYTTETETM